MRAEYEGERNFRTGGFDVKHLDTKLRDSMKRFYDVSLGITGRTSSRIESVAAALAETAGLPLFSRNKTRERTTRRSGPRARGLQLLDLMLIPPPEANPGVRIP